MVVDDSKQFQQSLTRLLSTVSGVAVVGYAEDVAGAREVVDVMKPDIVVLDVELRAGDHGIDVLRHIAQRHPTTKVVVLSNLNWETLRRIYLQAGAAAYFDKSMEFEQARSWITSCAQSSSTSSANLQSDAKPEVS